MASTVLPNGIIIPEKFSRDWYSDLYHNWEELDNLLAGGGANDGTLTIQKNGATVGTFSANQATDETIDITVPDVNNGTLTIQQNGTTVDTFTANSSSDKTVNIQCVDLTNNQTVAGNKEFTGTTTAHDVVPSATDTYNLGSSTAQWNNAYIKSLTINGVAAGNILTHNASEFVDVSSAQSVTGQKIFTSVLTGLGKDLYHFARFPYGKNTPPATASFQYVWFSGNTASQGFTNSWYGGFLEQEIDTDGTAQGRWLIRDTSESTVGIRLFVNGSNRQVRPTENNVVDLGTSTNKWKSFNGINPGALSLPSTNLINIASSITVLDGTTANTFTPQVNGWLLINGIGPANDGYIYVAQGHIGMVSANNTAMLRCAVLIPVVAGVEVAITCKLTTLTWANIIPCQGNV